MSMFAHPHYYPGFYRGVWADGRALSTPSVTVKWHFGDINWKWFVGGGLLVSGCYMVYSSGVVGYWLKIAGDWLISRYSVRFHHVRRSLFNTRFHYYPAREVEGHSHKTSAAARNGVVYAMDNFAFSTGSTLYTVSYSDRDRTTGQRLYYQPRDYSLEMRNDSLRPTDIIRMIDVDYYVDMNYWLSLGHPLILYTFVPTTAGGVTSDASYYFVGDRVRYKVNGGGTYEHQIWDYNCDFVTVDTWTGVYVYSVDQKETNCPERRVVYFTPRCFIPKPLSFLVTRNPLKRMKILHQGKWSCITSQDRTGKQFVSLARNASTYSVTLPRELYEAIRIRYTTSGNARNISDIERQLVKDKQEDAHIKAALLFECISQIELPCVNSTVVVSSGFASHYQTIRPLVTEVGKLYARSVGPSFAKAAFPAVSYNNDVACIEGRVTNVVNTKMPTAIYNNFAREYLQQLIPDDEVGRGVPWTAAQVIEKQDRPRQRIRSRVVQQWLGFSKMFVRSFQKKEAYTSITDPRNISTCPSDHVIRLSKYTLPFKDVLKRHSWYVPGLTPVEVTERVRDVCYTCDEVYSTDFSRLDGSISGWMREHLEQAAYLRHFGPDPELLQLLINDSRSKAVTSHDIRYDPGASRLSGSPLTTDGNTLICGFIPFTAYRLEGYSAEQAIRMTALVCGDDSLIANVSPARLKQVSEELGLSLKIDTSTRGEYVKFLGRVFVDPWTTSTSMQDPVRTLPKLNTTVTNPNEVPPKLALLWKAVGYLVMDRHTPLVSAYCEMVIKFYGAGHDYDVTNIPAVCLTDLPWFVRDIDARNHTWPQSSVDVSLMTEVMAMMLGITSSQVSTAHYLIDNIKDLQREWHKVIAALGDKAFLTVTPKLTAVIDTGTSDAVIVEPSVTTEDVPSTSASQPNFIAEVRQKSGKKKKSPSTQPGAKK